MYNFQTIGQNYLTYSSILSCEKNLIEISVKKNLQNFESIRKNVKMISKEQIVEDVSLDNLNVIEKKKFRISEFMKKMGKKYFNNLVKNLTTNYTTIYNLIIL